MGYLFDLVVILVLAGCVAIGLWRGAVRELLDLVAVAAGVVGVGVCQRLGLVLFGSVGGSPLVGRVASAFAQFLIVAAATRLVGWVLSRAALRGPVRLLDHGAGGMVALAKGVLLLGFALIALVRYPLFGTGWVRQSILSPLLLFAGRTFLDAFPPDFARAVRDVLVGS